MSGLLLERGITFLQSSVNLWFVGCFGFNGPFRQYFILYRAVTQKRRRKRRERIDESKNVQTTPTRTSASAVGPCPTVIRIVGRPGTGSLLSTIGPPDHPRSVNLSCALLSVSCSSEENAAMTILVTSLNVTFWRRQQRLRLEKSATNYITPE